MTTGSAVHLANMWARQTTCRPQRHCFVSVLDGECTVIREAAMSDITRAKSFEILSSNARQKSHFDNRVAVEEKCWLPYNSIQYDELQTHQNIYLVGLCKTTTEH